MNPGSYNLYQLDHSETVDEQIKASWIDVVVKGREPRYQVRPEILKSWLRCREIGLDPMSKNSPPVLSSKELSKLLKKNAEIIEIARPVIDMVEISVRNTGFIVTLTESQGYVLVVRGDSEILEMARENHYLPGCFRSIEHAGTNAIGLSLVERKPIQVTGAEHYNIHHHPWTCSSAPIINRQGKILGAITLSGKSIGKHKHTLALITAAAETIQGRIRERELNEEKHRLSSILSLIFNSIPDGVIAVNNNFEIVRMNKAAGKMLGLEMDSLTEKRLQDVLRTDPHLMDVIRERKSMTGKEIDFVCPLGHKSYICSVDPLHNDGGKNTGAIIRIARKRTMINLAKSLSGNYAKYEFKDIKGNNPKLKKQIKIAKIASKTNSRVLIVGESGTGKELFAQAIHNHSLRRNEPFVAISCAAIPRDLIESELFGYVGGAFTGARREGQLGKFELANKGTLFLDEINGLPLDLQAKLLRVLQENEVVRLGDTRVTNIDVRVIAATNIDLMSEVEYGNFREDLFYRLNVVELNIPPLRERIEDLEVLVEHILNRLCREMELRKPKISDEVIQIFREYSWPGNIRELENCLERALLLAQGKTIRKEHLSARILSPQPSVKLQQGSLREGLQQMIEAALARNKGNVSMASRELSISRSTLYRKMKEFGLR
ncbi:MAG: sigma 54-interacting transcriptional regulator [Deltaproteobacteria bacterium]|nr:sigma 54-interacting transcriptional regulator [Deltaproteobacteria bacterium]